MRPRTPLPSRPLRCAIYTRKSSIQGLEQAFNSLDAQREACLHFIQSQSHLGWQAIPQTFEDGGVSGSHLDRPGFQRLMSQVDAGALDVVVVYKVDRLSRSLLDFAKVMERFTAQNVAFVSVTQNFSTADAMGRLTLNMLMSFAEFEREMITERIRDKVSAARRKGRWTGGIVPFGYRVQNKVLVVVQEEVPRLRWLFETYLQGRSILDLVQHLNQEGVPFKSAVKARANPWSKGVVRNLLRNRMYLGEISSHGTWYRGQHEALIEPEVFYRVQGRLGRPSHRQGPGQRATHYLVRGSLRCGVCNAALTTASTRKRNKTYRYYRCTTRDKKGKLACPTRQLPADAIESFVVDQVRQAIGQGHLQVSELESLARRIAKDLEHLRAERAGVSGEAISSIETQIQDLERRLEDTEWLSGPMRDFEGMWGLLSPGNQQRFIQLLVQEVLVAEQEGVVRVRFRAFQEQV